MNALTLLKQDHQNVDALFERFEELAKGNGTKAKADVVQKIITHLSVHAAIEEQVFYPAVRAALADADIESTVLEALEEHHAVKLLLTEIEKLPPTAERFDAKVTVMIENVRHHVQEEEEELFPKVREAMTVQQLEELGEALDKAKEAAPTRPHPFQPDQPPLNVLLGLPVAVLDRALTTGKELLGKVLSRR
jgi:hemerythrin superfamily protein